MTKSVRLVWLTAFVIFVLTLFFLSSSRPSLGKTTDVLTAYDVHRDNSYINTGVKRQYPWVAAIPDSAIPYTYWDTSKALDPWHEMFVYQIILGIINEEIEAEEQRQKKIHDDAVMDEWRRNQGPMNRFFAGVVGFLLIILFGWLLYHSRRNRLVV